jgi:chemotaxis protein histidine kinase CheA
MRRALPILAVLVSLGLPVAASAAAETIHLEVSPTVPATNSTATLTVSGTDSESGSDIVIGSPYAASESCPATPSGERLRTPITVSSPSYSYKEPYYADVGFERICGYLVREDVTEATAELRVVFGPSEAELKKTEEEAKEKQEAEERARKQVQLTAERVKSEEEYDQAESKAANREKEEREATAHAAQASKEKEAAEQAARVAAARNTPLSHLTVKTIAHTEGSSQEPGYTELAIKAAPYAYVTVKLVRYGHSTEHYEWRESPGEGIIVPWTCTSPGGIYHYTISARTSVGHTLVRRGTFQPVTATRCHALKPHEAEVRERNARRYDEAREREALEHQEALERFEHNCQAEGGTTITLYTSEGTERACRGPNGGLLSVPH